MEIATATEPDLIPIKSIDRQPRLFIFGDNSCNQTGVSTTEESLLLPVEITNDLPIDNIGQICCNQTNTYIVLRTGEIYTCGSNDHNELARQGKRGLLARVDALETFQISTITLGEGFSSLICRDGKVLSWGRNDLGQLGSGNRENKDKPRLNNSFNEGILQVVSGAQHSIALTKSGKVLTFGGNKKGQLGDGQLTSSAIAIPLMQLRHRPVIAIACGEQHSLALTAGGNVFSWGDNSQGQLGHWDTTPRLRPELIKALRASKPLKIAAGKQHSMVVTQLGLLFAFGSNSNGQCGLGEEIRTQPTPVVVDTLRDLKTVSVACGAAHTLVLCHYVRPGSFYSNREVEPRVYVMGLNSSGQLGLGHNTSVYFPTYLLLSGQHQPVAVFSGPLAYHSFVLTGDTFHSPSYEIPSLSKDMIVNGIQKFIESHHESESTMKSGKNQHDGAVAVESKALKGIREMIAAGYSSISVLNASFLDPSTASHNMLCVDLRDVRSAYEAIMSTEKVTPAIVNTLGRATQHLAEQLNECPFDDAETLSVYMILMENPLLLRTSEFHVASEKLVNSLLSLPKYYRLMLFKWLKNYPSEFFGRALQLFQNYLTYSLLSRASNLSIAPVVMVIETLYQCNREDELVPEISFYNHTIPQTILLLDEWNKYKMNQESKVFNICSYLFLIQDTIKYKLIQEDFRVHKFQQYSLFSKKFLNDKYLKLDPGTGVLQLVQPTDESAEPIPLGLGIAVEETIFTRTIRMYLNLEVSRDNLLKDLMQTLKKIVSSNPQTLRLPMRASFKGEIGVDAGGISKELFSLAIRELIVSGNVLSLCNNGRSVWFSNTAQQSIKKRNLNQESELKTSTSSIPLERQVSFGSLDEGTRYSKEYYLGLIVGLAAYNGVYCDIPLPPSIYKILCDVKLTLSDLWAVDSELARGLQMLLDFEEGAGSIEDVFGATFTASANPLIQSSSSWYQGGNLSRQTSAEIIRQSSSIMGEVPLPSDGSETVNNKIARISSNPDHSVIPEVTNSEGNMDGRFLDEYRVALQERLLLSDPSGGDQTEGMEEDMSSDAQSDEVMSVTNGTNESALLQIAEEKKEDLSKDTVDSSVAMDVVTSSTTTAEPITSIGNDQLAADLAFAEKYNKIAQQSYRHQGSSTALGKKISRSYSQALHIASSKIVELMEGGEDIYVNRSNRQEYVKLFVNHALYECCKRQVNDYIAGLKFLFESPAIQKCTHSEVEHILCGFREIGDLSELRMSTKYKGVFNDEHPVINWFWDTLSSLSTSQKKKFLHFVTGSERIPIGGVSNLGLTIQSTEQEPIALPTSHTCFNILDMPRTYRSAEEVRERLLKALEYCQGFGLV